MLLGKKAFSQDFLYESFNVAIGGTFPAGWTAVNNAVPESSWNIQNPFTYSGNVLTMAGSNYAFANGDPGGSGSQTDVILTSPVINTSSSGLLFLEFKQHYRDYSGTPTDSGIVEVFDGTRWIKIQSLDQTTGTGSAPALTKYTITPYKNANMRVRFRYVGIWPWYWAIDDVRIFQPTPNDVGVLSILTPDGNCGLTANSQITVRVSNFGSANQPFIPVAYSINNGPPVTQSFSNPLAPGATADLVFTVGANLAASGTYKIRAWTNLAGDITFGNDSSGLKTVTKGSSVLAPVNFNSYDGENLSTAYPGWGERGGLTSLGTGSLWRKSTDVQTAYFGSAAAAINLFTNSRKEVIAAPPVNPDGTTGLTFKLALTNWQTVEPDQMGSDDSLCVFASTNCGLSWQILRTFKRADNISNTYQNVVVPLYQFSGQEVLVVLYASDGLIDDLEDYDILVDDIEFKSLPPNDINLFGITAPLSACGVNDAAVSVRLRNTGTLPQTNFPVCYTINGGNAICQNFVGTLQPNQEVVFTFSSSTVLSTPGDYTINSYSNLSNDQVRSNDTTKNFVFQNLPLIINYPYFESFETSNGGWIPGGIGSSWAVGTPNKTVITGAALGQKAYCTGGLGTGTYNFDEKSFVLSPCMNFSSLQNPVIEMRVWWHSEFSTDGTQLQGSIDGGATWVTIGKNGDYLNWFNTQAIPNFGTLTTPASRFGWSGGLGDGNGSGGWIIVQKLAPFLAGKTNVRLRLIFGSNGSQSGDGFAFDGVRIYERSNNDLGILSIENPQSAGCGLSAATPIKIKVINNGKAIQNNFTINYRIIGNSIVTQNITNANIASDSVKVYTFTTNANFDAPGNYGIQAWVNIPGDNFTSNDSIKNYRFLRRVSIADTLDFAGFDGFNLSSLNPGFSEGFGVDKPSGFVAGWVPCNANQALSLKSATAKLTMFATNKNDWILSPAFKVQSGTFLVFKSAVTNGADTTSDLMGSDDKLTIKISSDCGSTWQSVMVLNRDSSLTRKLRNFRFNLAPYVNQEIRFAFHATTGPINDPQDYEIHLDDIFVQTIVPADAGVNQIISPNLSCGLTSSVPIEVRVSNFGSSSITGFPVFYRINSNTPVSEIFTGTLAPFSSAIFTFSNPANLSVSQSYSIKSWAGLAGDVIFNNDSSKTNLVKVNAPFPIITFNGFNGANLSNVVPGWTEGVGVLPAGSSSAWTNGLIVGQTAAKIFLGGASKRDWLVSPGIRVGASSFLNFKAGLFAPNSTGPGTFDVDDSVSVMISTNCGQTWSTIYKLFKNTVPALNTNMQTYSVSINAFANQEIRIAFRARDGIRTDFTSDLYLDDVEISTSLVQDAGALSIIFPPLGMEKDSTYSNIFVKVSNYGVQTVSNVPVTLVMAGYTDTKTLASLEPGQTSNVQMAPYTPGIGGSFNAYAYSNLGSDQNRGNDTTYSSYLVTRIQNLISNDLGGFSLFPNPASNYVMVGGQSNLVPSFAYVIANAEGREVLSGSVALQKDELALIGIKELKPGFYTLRIRSGTGFKTFKFSVIK